MFIKTFALLRISSYSWG